MTQEATAAPAATPEPAAPAEPQGDATMNAFAESLGQLLEETSDAPGTPPAPVEPPAAEQPEAEPAEGAEAAQGESNGRPKVVDNEPQTWEQAKEARRARAAERHRQQQQSQEAFEQRILAAIDQKFAAMGQQAPAMPQQLAQALQGGTPLQQMRALAEAAGQPFEQYFGTAAQQMLRPGSEPAQRQANGANGKDGPPPWAQALMAELQQVKQQQAEIPLQWQQRQSQRQQEEDFKALARIPMTADAEYYPHIAAAPTQYIRQRMAAMVYDNYQLPPEQRYSNVDLATILDKELSGMYAHMNSRLSGSGPPAAAQAGIPPQGNVTAAPGQGTPSREAKPGQSPTAITNAVAAPDYSQMSDEDRLQAAGRLLSGADFAFSTTDS